MKLLIISSNAFSNKTNNGKTLESIFNFEKKENISQLYFSQNESPDFNYCDNYFQITDLHILRKICFLNNDCGHKVYATEIGQIQSKKQSFVHNLLKRYSSYLVIFRDLLWKTNVWKTQNFNLWCKSANPDIIFFVGGGYEFGHRVANYVQKELNIPLVTYFTDDYLIHPIRRNFLDLIQKERMKRFYFKTVKNSSLLFTIGDQMAKEYSDYFKKQFYSIMNSIELDHYVPYNQNDKLVISYFGGLHLERWKMILRISQFVNNSIIQIFTSTIPEQHILDSFKNTNIIYKGSISGDDLKNEMIKSDILLHVESDDSYYRSLTRLSVSTKIPEYLSTGRPIIGYGPKEVASMKLLDEHKIGFVISSNLNDNDLKENISNILLNYNLRVKIGYNGYTFAQNNFNNEKITQKFKEFLFSIHNPKN